MTEFQTNARPSGKYSNELAALLLAALVTSAVLGAAANVSAAPAEARLESVQIEIWPEYDRPMVLVILRGEVAADVGLPAEISLRIPASSGGPAAVAQTDVKRGRLLNLGHERSDASEFITLRFAVPARFFQVEFYDRFAAGTSERSYKYVWPGDLSASWLDVVVQEPAGASNLSVKPALDESSTGTDGMRYRSAQLGPAKKGATLPIEIRYTKTDPRTSAEILGLKAPAKGSPAAALPAQDASSWLLPAIGGVASLIAACAAGYWLWRRRRVAHAPIDSARAAFCRRCGNAVADGDRFCSKCGAALQ